MRLSLRHIEIHDDVTLLDILQLVRVHNRLLLLIPKPKEFLVIAHLDPINQPWQQSKQLCQQVRVP